MDEQPRVRSIRVSVSDERCTLSGRLTDGTEAEVLSYFVDELTFSADELIGLTLAEARRLHFQHDRAYLRAGERPATPIRLRERREWQRPGGRSRA